MLSELGSCPQLAWEQNSCSTDSNRFKFIPTSSTVSKHFHSNSPKQVSSHDVLVNNAEQSRG
jgi:hypothetical protein